MKFYAPADARRFIFGPGRGILILATTAVSLCLYAYFLPHAPGGRRILQSVNMDFLVGKVERDYVLRFVAAAFFLGILPVFIMCILSSPRTAVHEIGLVLPRGRVFRSRMFLGLWFFCISAGVFGAFNNGLANFYPYSQMLTVHAPSVRGFLFHAFAYSLLYYIPWEITFRGFLILPFLSVFLEDTQGVNARSLTVVSMQSIPSALLHFGHPLSESLGAIVFGVVAGFLVLRYRSIWPAFILHASTGIALDLTLLMRAVL